jgi:glycine cleavage system H protein
VEYPADLKYTDDHEWLRVEDDTGTVGITDFAQRELTDIVFIELPSVGDVIAQGETFGTVEAIKAVSDLYCPVDGKIVEVNEELTDHPEWVNDDPYGSGWMIKIEMADPEQAEALLTADQYKENVE